MKKLNFRNFLILSVLAHFILFLLFILFDFKESFFSRKTVLPQAIRVDVVGLPDIMPAKEKVIKKNKSTIKMEQKSSRDKKKAVKKKRDSPPPKNQPSYKGNQLSEGAGQEGLAGVRTNIYITEITGIIKSHWNIPSYIKDQNLKTEIEVKIDKNGNITKKKILKSSQNKTFDLKVLEAITNAEPFPKPPALVQGLIKDGIVFVLNSQDD